MISLDERVKPPDNVDIVKIILVIGARSFLPLDEHNNLLPKPAPENFLPTNQLFSPPQISASSVFSSFLRSSQETRDLLVFYLTGHLFFACVCQELMDLCENIDENHQCSSESAALFRTLPCGAE
ncbi:hypothetical protein FHG87_001932 [Trinorchestia longiramus]|nr:hypothetical protein FHG87_001932 [Trinorchestia longiramus]